MKKRSIIFLQIVVALIGIGALILILWEPQIEGRNARSTLFQIYFKDPFLAYAYVASIAFFVALRQVFTLLGHIRQNKAFAPNSVKALRTIKYCAMSLVGFIVVAEAYLFIAQPGDDISGGVFIGLLLIVVFGVSASAVAKFERIFQNAVDIKSKNDLTSLDK